MKTCRHRLCRGTVSPPSTVRWRRSIDLPGAQPRYEQQRAALALAGGRVWVELGGLFGDCGPYHGKIVGVRADEQRNARWRCRVNVDDRPQTYCSVEVAAHLSGMNVTRVRRLVRAGPPAR